MFISKTVSIIIPIYNSEKFLNECIESAAKQTYKELEIILINDGSKDSSLNICNDWVLRDNRIKVYSQENKGVSAARNLGLSNANGEYIMFLDSDDLLSPNCCETLINKMSENVDMAITGLADYTWEPPKTKNRFFKTGYHNNYDVRKITIDNGSMSGFTIASTCSTLYKNEIIKKYNIKFAEDIFYNEDGLFNAEYIFQSNANNKIYIDYNTRLYLYRYNPDSATHTVDLSTTKYKNSMILGFTRLKELECKVQDENITKQLTLRYSSLYLKQLIFFVNKKDIYNINEILKNKRFNESLKLISFHKLSLRRKVLYFILRIKCSKLLCLLLKNK